MENSIPGESGGVMRRAGEGNLPWLPENLWCRISGSTVREHIANRQMRKGSALKLWMMQGIPGQKMA